MANNISREEIVLLNRLVENTSPKRFTLDAFSTTSSGTIHAGFHKVTIYNAGSNAGQFTVGSGSAIDLPSGVTIDLSGGEKGDISNTTITYDANSGSGTTFIITVSKI